MTSIAVACNYFNEAHALPGLLECVSPWADEIIMYEAGPQGEHSSDGSIELLEKWGVDLRFGSIDEGFGVVRTRLITMGRCDWTVIMDADERIYKHVGRLQCIGNDSYDVGKHYPELADVALSVQTHGLYDQIAALKSLMRPEYDAIVTSRRHWQDLSLTRPSQNWHQIADWQARILRNCPHVQYISAVKMHERLVDIRTGNTPKWYQPQESNVEIFHDHFHLFWKRFEREQRAHDVATYNSLCEGAKPLTWAQFRAKRDQNILEPDGGCA